MSVHGANPIFWNEKIKIGRPEYSLSPHPPTSDNISFLPYLPTPPSPQPSTWKSYVYHSLRISSVNLTKYAGNCVFGHIYWRNPSWKTSFLCSEKWGKMIKLKGKLGVTVTLLINVLKWCDVIKAHHMITPIFYYYLFNRYAYQVS